MTTAIPLGLPPVSPGLSVPAPAGRVGTVAEDFEAVLLTQLLKGLRRTVPEASESNTVRDLYHELHDEMLAAHLARTGGIGLAAIIRAYLDRSPAAGTAHLPGVGGNK